jgi:hypothetical protein
VTRYCRWCDDFVRARKHANGALYCAVCKWPLTKPTRSPYDEAWGGDLKADDEILKLESGADAAPVDGEVGRG